MLLFINTSIILSSMTPALSINNTILLLNFMVLMLFLLFLLMLYQLFNLTLVVLLVYTSLIVLLFLVNGMLWLDSN